ncbi:hypothetical protein SSS_05316 [Sarcoptes scabiei]|uniref:BTB domain-containing protein n=1 Tax=Sarcoptes scabiei TaxID=52283 RepID=A0A834R863_SARSC|nr:hypothetical protein SSS_05316 [Sarcoptes scabiei]
MKLILILLFHATLIFSQSIDLESDDDQDDYVITTSSSEIPSSDQSQPSSGSESYDSSELDEKSFQPQIDRDIYRQLLQNAYQYPQQTVPVPSNPINYWQTLSGHTIRAYGTNVHQHSHQHAQQPRQPMPASNPYLIGRRVTIQQPGRHHQPQAPNYSIYSVTNPYHRPMEARPLIPSSVPACPEFDSNEIDENYLRRFQDWYLSSTYHDVTFSVCGNLLPAHRLLLETISPEFSQWIYVNSQFHPDTAENIIEVRNFNQILNPLVEKSKAIGDLALDEANACEADSTLLNSFKIFLEYFYRGSKAFDSLGSVNEAMNLMVLSKKFLADKKTEEAIGTKLVDLMTPEDLERVYRFSKQNQITSLKPKWSGYIRRSMDSFDDGPAESRSSQIFTCQEIIEDIEMFDDFLTSRNQSQSLIVDQIVGYYLSCPQLMNSSLNNLGSFPNSLRLNECTVDDLKRLLGVNLIDHNRFEEILIDRLNSQTRSCQESRPIGAAYPNPINEPVKVDPYGGTFRIS